MSTAIRRPAVSGRFYPGDEASLGKLVDDLLEEARRRSGPEEMEGLEGTVLGAVVPHAGYRYSGPVAAAAYARVAGFDPDAVVVIGPDHFVGFDGVAVYGRGAFETPLGTVPIDEGLADELLAGGSESLLDAPHLHAREHSLEVQVPFLQRIYPGRRMLPLLIGGRSERHTEVLSDALARILSGRRALLLASSDLSHYHPRWKALELDSLVIERVRDVDPEGLMDLLSRGDAEACGGAPMVAVLKTCRKLGAAQAEILDYADSGDASGDLDQVVGYLAALIHESGPESVRRRLASRERSRPSTGLPAPAGAPGPAGVPVSACPPAVPEATARRLLELARRGVIEAASGSGEGYQDGNEPPDTDPTGGVFVTLRKDKSLRGCIGFLVRRTSLAESVFRAAQAAAREDPRFLPVSVEEVADLSVEVSILSEAFTARPEDLEIGRHGVVVSRGRRRGLLLPQVALEHGWDRRRFLEEACRKAELPSDAWREDAEVRLFEARILTEEKPA